MCHNKYFGDDQSSCINSLIIRGAHISVSKNVLLLYIPYCSSSKEISDWRVVFWRPQVVVVSLVETVPNDPSTVTCFHPSDLLTVTY